MENNTVTVKAPTENGANKMKPLKPIRKDIKSLSDAEYDAIFRAVINGSNIKSPAIHNMYNIKKNIKAIPTKPIIALRPANGKLQATGKSTKPQSSTIDKPSTTFVKPSTAPKTSSKLQTKPKSSSNSKVPKKSVSPVLADIASMVIAKSPKESASLENSQNSPEHAVTTLIAANIDTSLSTLLSDDFVNNAVCSTPNLSKTYGDTLKYLEKISESFSEVDSLLMETEGLPLSQPSETLTKRERLEWLQKRRGTGLWVQCDHENCNKWRWLNIEDPTDLPELWFCSMNPDRAQSSCDAPETPLSVYEEQDLIYNKYTAGSIVWIKMAGYPWWPAMVDDDPDTEQYYWMDDEYSVTPDWYHVVFFDTEVSRAWSRLKNIRPFKEENLIKQISKNNVYYNRLKIAKQMARDAEKLNIKERLQKYSFLTNWKKDIPGEKQIKKTEKEKSNNENKSKSNKRGRKKKSVDSSDTDKLNKGNDTRQNISNKKMYKNKEKNKAIEEKPVENNKKMQNTNIEVVNINDTEKEVVEEVKKSFKLFKQQQKENDENEKQILENKMKKSLKTTFKLLDKSNGTTSSFTSSTYSEINTSSECQTEIEQNDLNKSNIESITDKKRRVEDECLPQTPKKKKKGFVTPLKTGLRNYTKKTY